MKFTFASGQKPLDGYTIKRGIGRGGFGEVYFALSDGGKEVALKLIRGHEDIELRGIQQCINLKHPNLVHLYDLKIDATGNYWLVMEHVAGDPLSLHLARHPSGLPIELAAAWFAGLTSAIHYLHDHGLVHRDLKPANVFIENSVVKVGDYGLCKFIGSSQRVAQTQSVGTVHYMAPEISTGNYNRQIDIYAAGILLYEMLTGKVPFEGETAGEILMKHLTAPPDLSQLPRAFAPIVGQALSKNPAHRYQHIAEMGKHVAAVVAKKEEPVVARTLADTLPHPSKAGAGETTGEPSVTMRQRLIGLVVSLITATLLAGILAFAGAMVLFKGDWEQMIGPFVLSTAGAWGVLISSFAWSKNLEESGHRRLILGGVGIALGVLALWLDGFQLPWPGVDPAAVDSLRALPGPAPEEPRHGFYDALYPPNRSLPVLAGYLAYFGLMFLALRWWRLVDPARPQRFLLGPVLGVGFWAFMLLFLLPATVQRQEAFLTMVQLAVVVQLASPSEQMQVVRHKRMRLRYA